MYLRIAASVLLSVLISLAYICWPLGIPWEHEDQPGVYSITWHSALVFLALVTLTFFALYRLRHLSARR